MDQEIKNHFQELKKEMQEVKSILMGIKLTIDNHFAPTKKVKVLGTTSASYKGDDDDTL